ncbi:hypothetical protein J3R82DRAFT_2566 [Butyriboletus roseoflavus]|nr:hypothetical protein J3R82DRAFT_2566 [Butyriboletus roseoflavus]
MSGDSAYAVAPFDHPKADVILRSSDNIDFRIFKLFLSLASPFFETLFDIPQPAQESDHQEIKDGLVVIPVTEDSKTVDSLLRFCYPCTLADDPKLEVLKVAAGVLEAARKYSLDAIEIKARQAISNPKILEAEPLRCFAIAHRGRLRAETLLAARYTLTQPLVPSWFQEIELITAADLLSLLTYHRRCGDAVYALKFDLSWITSHYTNLLACTWLSHYDSSYNERHCRCPRADMSSYVLFNMNPPQWWVDFMEEAFPKLQHKPCKATVQACSEKAVRNVKAGSCRGCAPKVAEEMRDFSDLFVRKIEKIVSQVNRPTEIPQRA